jgi:hypothetical protein
MGVRNGKSGEPSPDEAVARAESKPTRSRKPYQKPAFQFERVFETMALACGKVSTTQSQCRLGGRKNS